MSDRNSLRGECPARIVRVLFGQKFSRWELFVGKCLQKISGRIAWDGVQILMQDYKSLHAAVMICATQVNTCTHTHDMSAHTYRYTYK